MSVIKTCLDVRPRIYNINLEWEEVKMLLSAAEEASRKRKKSCCKRPEFWSKYIPKIIRDKRKHIKKVYNILET
jgi:hypothetical protein